MGGHFWSETGFGGPKGGYSLKKIQKNFPGIFCQRIERKSQEVSATYVKPLGRDIYIFIHSYVQSNIGDHNLDRMENFVFLFFLHFYFPCFVQKFLIF